jgi:hypothetical protein
MMALCWPLAIKAARLQHSINKKILDANQVSNHGELNLIEQFQFSGGSGLELGCHCR